MTDSELLSVKAEGVRIQNTLRILMQDMNVRMMDRDKNDPRRTSYDAFMYTPRQVMSSSELEHLIRGMLTFIEYQIKALLSDDLKGQAAVDPLQLVGWVDDQMVGTQRWMEQVDMEIGRRGV